MLPGGWGVSLAQRLGGWRGSRAVAGATPGLQAGPGVASSVAAVPAVENRAIGKDGSPIIVLLPSIQPFHSTYSFHLFIPLIPSTYSFLQIFSETIWDFPLQVLGLVDLEMTHQLPTETAESRKKSLPIE